MLTTTFSQLRDLKACSSRYTHLVKVLGKNYGDETPITIKQVFDICGYWDARWLVMRSYRYEFIDMKEGKYCMNLVWQWQKKLQDVNNNV